MRTEREVSDQLSMIDGTGTRWPGMTYEEGVEAALIWVMGGEDAPMDDDDDV